MNSIRDFKLGEFCTQAAFDIRAAGGQLCMVGGAVRHHFMEQFHTDDFGEIADWDMEAHNITANDLERVMSDWNVEVKFVGKQFGIYEFKAAGQKYQINLPTVRTKSGYGHNDEVAQIVPDLPMVECMRRRNFTINSITRNILTGEVIDLFGGINDCRMRYLRATDQEKFVEDPLRPLNGLKLSGIYNLTATNGLIDLCLSRVNDIRLLPPSRIWEEWWSWATRSLCPAAGIRYLLDIGWIKNYPDINALINLPQHPEWHPEGDVFVHTGLVSNAAVHIALREQLSDEDRGVLVLAALLHDVGKAVTTEWSEERGGWASPGHDLAGVPIARSFLDSINCPHDIRDRVLEMVREHMVHVHTPSPDKRYVRRFLARLKHSSFDDIMRIIEADHSGRPPLPGGLPTRAIKMCEIADEIGKEIKPTLLGRHLIELGLKPGNHFSKILADAFEAQQEGEFETLEQGKKWLAERIIK